MLMYMFVCVTYSTTRHTKIRHSSGVLCRDIEGELLLEHLEIFRIGDTLFWETLCRIVNLSMLVIWSSLIKGEMEPNARLSRSVLTPTKLVPVLLQFSKLRLTPKNIVNSKRIIAYLREKETSTP